MPRTTADSANLLNPSCGISAWLSPKGFLHLPQIRQALFVSFICHYYHTPRGNSKPRRKKSFRGIWALFANPRSFSLQPGSCTELPPADKRADLEQNKSPEVILVSELVPKSRKKLCIGSGARTLEGQKPVPPTNPGPYLREQCPPNKGSL